LETPEQGGTVAEHLMEELARLFSINQEAIQIGASIGISIFPQNAQELDELCDKADLALYQAKADGRSAYRFYTPEMDKAAHRRSP
jgi:diguanylate cyclase (GGDEF)-like protein